MGRGEAAAGIAGSGAEEGAAIGQTVGNLIDTRLPGSNGRVNFGWNIGNKAE